MRLNNKLKYAVPMVVTALLLCLIYIIKGIFPFGHNTIDYYDMAQQITAFYYHTFDFLHGEKNLFYDPYTALSVNMAMSTSGCSHLSIFNLFFLFVKREAILESLSIFLMIKMMLMSLFMYIYIHKSYKLSYYYELIFSVGYAFCGYVMMLYMTIQWLDVAALFPLLMLFLRKLLKDGKSCGYVITLSLMIIASYYQSFMILIYIILMVGTALFGDFLFKNRDYKLIYEKYHLLKLFIATVISLMLSAFIVVPQIKQTLNSARFNNENGGGLLNKYYGIVSTVKPAYTSRWWSLLLLSFAFAVIAYGLYTYRNDKKQMTVTVITLFIILSELIVEGVNLFWHFGSYVGYPIRNGYMIYFTVVCVACGYAERLCAGECFNEKLSGIVITCIMAVLTAGVIIVYSGMEGLTLRNVFHITSLVMFTTFLVYLILLFTGKGRIPRVTALLVVAEVLLFGFIMIGKPAYSSANTNDPEQEGDYIDTSLQLDEAFSLNAADYDNNGESLLFSRVKNPDTSLNANYGLILRRPVLSNWTHLLSPLLQRDAAKLGYSVQYTRLLDAGGTVFSDALIGIDEVISLIPLDEALYGLSGSTETVNKTTGEKTKYYLYKCKFTLPFGVVTNSADYDFENAATIDLYNSIYESLTGKKEKIVEPVELNEDGKTAITGKKALYYMSNRIDTDDYNTEIKVNGNTVTVPSITEPDNTLYPAHFNNNALYLGSFNNEEVNIDIDISDYDRLGNEIEGEINSELIAIDLDRLLALCGGYNDRVSIRTAYKSGYSFTVNADDNDSFFLIPLSYDKGYNASVNGVKEEVLPVGGMFCAIHLNKGENDIELRFMPDGMIAGIIISLIGLSAFFVYVYLDKKCDIFNTELLWLNNLYLAMFVIAMIFMYAVPYAFAVVTVLHIV